MTNPYVLTPACIISEEEVDRAMQELEAATNRVWLTLSQREDANERIGKNPRNKMVKS